MFSGTACLLPPASCLLPPASLNTYPPSMAGFAADEISHCIRPEDINLRRAVIVLRYLGQGPYTPPGLLQALSRDCSPDDGRGAGGSHKGRDAVQDAR